MQFGSMLRKTRLRSGLSQEELAEKIFISRSAVSRLENDKLELKLADAIRWFQATQAPEALAALLCGIDITTVVQSLSTLIGGFMIWI
ncbi:helix-turn-helix domain-containing protein [Peribacillus loiseleuriae]|uniref:helix-turn-helix domain-containing protein n=1 Tax=Peribacillus loiseleuriae TaxID=1679170 RepID=UPI003D02592A